MKAFVASIAICVLLITSVTTSADFPDRVYRFVELTDEEVARIDLKDTSVDDWLEVVGEPSLWPLDFAVAPGSVHDPSSLDFRIWLAWHDKTDRLYVAAEFIDDIHIDFFDPSSETFLGTCGEPNLQFLIDGDQGGGFVFETDNYDGDYYPGRHVQWYWACPGMFSDGVNLRMFSNSRVTPWVHLPPFADGGSGWFSERPTFFIMEFYVTAFDLLPWLGGRPEDSVVSDLYPGKHISFALRIEDRDAPLDEADFYSIYGHTFDEGADYLDADHWALGVLEGRGETTGGNTSVRDLTWGRIKASLSE